jgi:hypothetical protein
MPVKIDYEKAIPAAIKRNVRVMTGAPLPFIGVRGIRYMGKQLLKLECDATKRTQYLPLYLGHIVRMQEEIGTGGAGFRFIYAAFLREASRLLNSAFVKRSGNSNDGSGRPLAFVCAARQQDVQRLCVKRKLGKWMCFLEKYPS